jgi:hypothetical protein
VLALALAPRAHPAAAQKRLLGEIDFFGYKGLDVAAVRAALPFHEGEEFPPPKGHSDDLKRQVRERVHQVIGRDPTDVAFVCCDAHQNSMVYIGLPGGTYQEPVFNPQPTGTVRLPKEAITLRQKAENAWSNAVMSGHATEDDSAGYALTNDPKARSAELALRDYALRNEALLFEVVASSANANQRAIAAQMIGYGRQSDAQVAALVRASLDPDDGVRNDAVRALEVLATAKPELARQIPLAPYIRLIRSGAWSDHNKGSLVLVALTVSRDPKVLAQLRADALGALLEMARWRSLGHAEAALTVLGRIADIEEARLEKLIGSGDVQTILASFGGN